MAPRHMSLHQSSGPSARRRLLVGGQIGIFIGAAALQLVTPFSVFASSLVSANFSGGTGTANVGGTEYAKSGAALTLTVVTDTATNCVTLSGTHTGSSTAPSSSNGSSKTWTFSLTADTGADGVRDTTVTAFDDTSCSSSQTNTVASYTVDNTRPTITAAVNPAPNVNGWNNTPTTVSFTCADDGSGVRLCPGSTTFLTNGVDQEAGGTATDFVGNRSLPAFGTVNLDMDGPTVTGSPAGSPNGAGWYNSDVTVDWTCADTGGSGLASDACDDTVITGEGSGLTSTRTVTDLAGNVSAPATSAPAVNIDRTAPTTTASSVPAWSNSTVNITLSATDSLSGVASTFYTVDGGLVQTYSGGTIDFASEGGYSLEFWSVDNAGNVETHQVATVNVDETAPSIVASQAPGANSSGWNNSDVTVSFSCSDALSGVASCPADTVVSTEGANQSVSGSVFDNAGNQASTSLSVSLDKTAPNVSVEGVSDGGTYDVGTYSASCSTTDSLSGVATPATLSTTGGPTGTVTVTCSGATDVAGNAQANEVSATFTVTSTTQGYQFGGFQRPLGAAGSVNSAQPGQSLPVKFSLGGYRGMNIFAPGYPATSAYSCGTPPPATGAAVSMSDWLSYDASSDTYSFVWKTDKSWTGCRALQLNFSDGSGAVAMFDFGGSTGQSKPGKKH